MFEIPWHFDEPWLGAGLFLVMGGGVIAGWWFSRTARGEEMHRRMWDSKWGRMMLFTNPPKGRMTYFMLGCFGVLVLAGLFFAAVGLGIIKNGPG